MVGGARRRVEFSIGVKVVALNVNGIRSAERRGFSRWLEMERPDVLLLQEVRAALDDIPAGLRAPEGYTVA